MKKLSNHYEKNGFYGIGIIHGKEHLNYGTLFRTAQIFDADFTFVIGTKYKPQKTDTLRSFKHIPSYSYHDFPDFINHRPFDCNLISIEITHEAINLTEFSHPKRAIYILGAEDDGLPVEVLKACNETVCIYEERSLNVAVAGSIVLYDRLSKQLSK